MGISHHKNITHWLYDTYIITRITLKRSPGVWNTKPMATRSRVFHKNGHKRNIIEFFILKFCCFTDNIIPFRPGILQCMDWFLHMWQLVLCSRYPWEPTFCKGILKPVDGVKLQKTQSPPHPFKFFHFYDKFWITSNNYRPIKEGSRWLKSGLKGENSLCLKVQKMEQNSIFHNTKNEHLKLKLPIPLKPVKTAGFARYSWIRGLKTQKFTSNTRIFVK